MSQYHIAEITFGTPEYDEAVRLRYDVLRKPLGLFFNPEGLAVEYDHFHIGYYNDRQVLTGYLILTPIDEKRIKMRQVAVSEQAQRTGVGRILVAYAETRAKELGYEIMELNARETAAPFYDRLAYDRVGERFEEVGIPHIKMKKNL
jgi:predicted GNAT family N-acyltransferase